MQMFFSRMLARSFGRGFESKLTVGFDNFIILTKFGPGCNQNNAISLLFLSSQIVIIISETRKLRPFKAGQRNKYKCGQGFAQLYLASDILPSVRQIMTKLEVFHHEGQCFTFLLPCLLEHCKILPRQSHLTLVRPSFLLYCNFKLVWLLKGNISLRYESYQKAGKYYLLDQ